jgi:hypothetical protein
LGRTWRVGRAKNQAAFPILIKLLKTDKKETVIDAARALGVLDDRRAARALLDVLKRKDADETRADKGSYAGRNTIRNAVYSSMGRFFSSHGTLASNALSKGEAYDWESVVTGWEAGWVEVKIESFPKGQGYAQRTVGLGGRIKGGHMSGGKEAPRISESPSRVSLKDMRRIGLLCKKLRVVPVTAQERPDQSKAGYRVVTIEYNDGATRVFIKGWDEKLKPADAQSILEINGLKGDG